VAVQRYDDAIKEFNLTLQLTPQFVEAAYHLGEMYEKLGNTAEAIKSYEKTVSNAPNATDFWAARASERLRILKK
jgi:tetratricopeptide (TPR) repeat protein